ncbi:glycoside hydrolase family 13 protein [Xylona heveae TC161]|uniref:Glycoside hydrolase family 13 protein n=1 Tax=Xylona heveae (strain CBS 132557 / TC161) TaxID=1328760 RepID=A0A165HYM0_XYLHT|nr:glycoside hydrolase family 13 protein [Xylona heveae TC161]KZF24103.1 glycoside hydrolase family 13 protein [Xylona heveae TC161]
MSSKANREPTPENETLLQAFEWHVPGGQTHWHRLRNALAGLKAVGISAIWLPPGCKAGCPDSVGYDIYDLYDIGEFDQKGARATKWGTREELMQLMDEATKLDVKVYWDAVLNHKAAADRTERCPVVEVDPNDRNRELTAPFEIEAWLAFDFLGRKNKYSSQKYNWKHFSGTDYNAENHRQAIYRIYGENKQWSQAVGDEHGNADYLLFADLDYADPEVRKDVKRWGEWIVKETGVQGFRFDAVQHFSQDFMNEFLGHLDRTVGHGLFSVGEYWHGDVEVLTRYLDKMEHPYSVFDVALFYNFSKMTKNGDLLSVLQNSLVERRPANAVTIVGNHDTQKGQTMEAAVEPFFKTLAYCLILLRQDGYPCPFYGDLYGTKGPYAEGPSCGGRLADIILARKLYAYGTQDDYFDARTCVGWVRRGSWDRPDGLACVMSTAGSAKKRMYVGKSHKGELWTDILGWTPFKVIIDNKGYGMFACNGASVSIWVNSAAKGREQFGSFDANIYNE